MGTNTWCNDINSIPVDTRVNAILYGLRTQEIQYVECGYGFGKELTFENFCITFGYDNSKFSFVIYTSRHSGYIAPTYLCSGEISCEDDLNKIENCIKQAINNYFGFGN